MAIAPYPSFCPSVPPALPSRKKLFVTFPPVFQNWIALPQWSTTRPEKYDRSMVADPPPWRYRALPPPMLPPPARPSKTQSLTTRDTLLKMTLPCQPVFMWSKKSQPRNTGAWSFEPVT